MKKYEIVIIRDSEIKVIGGYSTYKNACAMADSWKEFYKRHTEFKCNHSEIFVRETI